MIFGRFLWSRDMRAVRHRPGTVRCVASSILRSLLNDPSVTWRLVRRPSEMIVVQRQALKSLAGVEGGDEGRCVNQNGLRTKGRGQLMSRSV